MISPDAKGPGGVPSWALTLSFVSLMVPVIGDLLVDRATLGPYQALIWLFALIPALLLAYYRGWRGVAVAVGAGIVTLAGYQALVSRVGLEVPSYLPGIVVAFLTLALGIGWLVERLHKDRAQVEELALTDLLTHLPNRRHARVFLENEFAAAERGRLLSVVLFDLDSFKIYNDRYGHQAGDEALTIFAGILFQTTRKMNLSARFGGEEFLSVLAGTDVEGAMVFAERVRATLKAMKLPRGSLTVSAGVASFHKTMRSPDELLAAADHALYQAKREGRNRVRLFGRTLLEEAVSVIGTSGVEMRGQRLGVYPRAPRDLGRTRPPITLLPHQVTGFGVERQLLVVEDDEPLRDLLSSYLKKEGFEVTAAPDVHSALGHLGTEFDVLVTDLRLPGEWGTELITSMKARWPGTQIIVITGVEDEVIRARAMEAGADRLLEKPFGMAELRAELQEALGRRKRSGAHRGGRVAGAEVRVRSDVAKQHLSEGIQSLVSAVEIRDPCTHGHHRRVTLYAAEILKAFDPEGRFLSPHSLALGTEQMDIGMIGVPDQILLKAGTLSKEEQDYLREHPEIGRRILHSIVQDEAALAVVTWHHERWDGTGYPNGLKGEDIPLAARIAAIADSLDALTCCRSHRKAFEWKKAVEQILSESGEKFDPAVVKAFEAALPMLKEIWENLGDQGRPAPVNTPH